MDTTTMTAQLQTIFNEVEPGKVPAEMKKDFRQVAVRFVCTAGPGELVRCTRYKPHALGCTFQHNNGDCEAV